MFRAKFLLNIISWLPSWMWVYPVLNKAVKLNLKFFSKAAFCNTLAFLMEVARKLVCFGKQKYGIRQKN